jgi:hypothetical protein
MLTMKQLKYADAVSDGNSQSSAYRGAYNTLKMAPKTIWEASSRLRKNPKVAARILELETEKEVRLRMQALSRQDRVLKELENIGFGDGPASAKLKALELLGKHVGLLTAK